MPIMQLERSYNALYSALSYTIHNNEEDATSALLEYGANAQGAESSPLRSPLSEATLRGNGSLIETLLQAGASFADGRSFDKAPLFYADKLPVEWVHQNLSDLVQFLPLNAKPIFHTPHAQGGHYFTWLERLSEDLEKLGFAAKHGLDLRMTAYEAAHLIHFGRYEAFCLILDRTAPGLKEPVLVRVRAEFPKFGVL